MEFFHRARTFVISSLLKNVMHECGLQQRALADTLGVTLDRVKSLTSGKVQKLTREETEALIRKLNIRADWLATGSGPMFQSAGEQRAQAALERVGTAAQAAARLDLPEAAAARLMELLYYVESGNGEGARRILADLAKLSPEESTLINSYRKCPEPARATLLQTAILLSAGISPPSPASRKQEIVIGGVAGDIKQVQGDYHETGTTIVGGKGRKK